MRVETSHKKRANYDVRFCSCGRIHFIDYDELCKVCDDENKEVLFICNNCGAVTRIGLDDYMEGKAWNSYDMRETELNDLSKFGKIIMSTGTKIPMKSGAAATAEWCGKFTDLETKKPEEISEADWEKVVSTVDTQRLIKEIDDEDKLKCLSSYVIKIDWSGTKYCR